MGSSASHASLFSGLPRTRLPFAEFAFGTGTQVVAVALLIWMRIFFPPAVASVEPTFEPIRLVNTPQPVPEQPQPARTMVEPMRKIWIVPPVSPNQPKYFARTTDTPAPSVSVANNMADKNINSLPLAAAPVIPREAVKVNLFSSGSSAPPSTSKAASQVQSAGFGDPNGVPAKAGQRRPVTIASAGSFDLPPGAGYGNGTSRKETAGVVPNAGFGNETAAATRAHGASGAVQETAFAGAVVPASSKRSLSNEPAAQVFPAEILSKPLPSYTVEARALRIQGEVLLEVVLQASGNLHVVRVVQGLGHGLDDNAVKAAEQIRFKPAMRDGRPADSTVVLHVVFQLA